MARRLLLHCTVPPVKMALPRRALALVLEWASLHRDELRADWELARAERPLVPVAPLE